MAVEGPNDLRQEHPHPHDAILDPDGRFVLVPDLGTDLIQRYLVNKDGRRGLTRLAPIVLPAGSGPRHGVFVKTDDAPTYFYLLSEMGNSVTGYSVSYPGYSSIELTQVYYTTIHETGGWMPNGKDVLGGEIGLSVRNNLFIANSSQMTLQSCQILTRNSSNLARWQFHPGHYPHGHHLSRQDEHLVHHSEPRPQQQDRYGLGPFRKLQD